MRTGSEPQRNRVRKPTKCIVVLKVEFELGLLEEMARLVAKSFDDIDKFLFGAFPKRVESLADAADAIGGSPLRGGQHRGLQPLQDK
ncbi:hypothetical protein GCM10028771_23480 [Nocardioides marmoraquaticus]